MSRETHLLDTYRRLFAGAAVLLVLALTVLAASPELHAKLHASDAGHDDGCAVALFATSTSVPITAVTVAPAAAEHVVPQVLASDEISLASPRYLRQPERGPPERR